MNAYAVVQSVYNGLVRDHLPRKYAIHAGVAARDTPLLDMTDQFPDYKKGLIDSIQERVGDGDQAVLVAAGRGVSAVWLARMGADVVAYEAADEMLSIARDTVEIEGVGDAVEFRHALVGEAIDVYGEFSDAANVPPADLDPGDVLVLDCEGAERAILTGIETLPGRVIVETHPEQGVPTELVGDILEARGYRKIIERRYEPDQQHPTKRVLVASEP